MASGLTTIPWVVVMSCVGLFCLHTYNVVGTMFCSFFLSIAWYPNEEWINMMRDTVLSVAPKGLDQVGFKSGNKIYFC